MGDDRLTRVLTLKFSKTNIPQNAKHELRKRLFVAVEIPDDDLDQIAAAGDLTAKIKLDNKSGKE